MAEVEPVSDDREFRAFPDLQKLSDEELSEIYLRGENLHIHTSRASAAKRLLDLRKREREDEAVRELQKAAEQLKESNEGIQVIVGILTFFKKKWLPKQPLLLRIGIFIFGTILLGIILNLIAAWIALFIFNWR